jgi:hypothetical protein
VTLAWSGSATPTSDYAVASTGATLSPDNLTLTFAAGATAATVTVTPVDDSQPEVTENVTLTISAGTGYTVGSPSSAIGTITDNEPPSVSVTPTDAAGAEQGSGPIVFTVTRTGSTTGTLAVTLTWTGTAALTTDYAIAAAGGTLSNNGLTLTFAAGSATATVTVTPVDDTAVEDNESVTMTVVNGPGYSPDPTAVAATGIIAENDVGISVAATDANGAEQASDPIVFTVTRTGNTSNSTAVTLAWNGTAALGTDYTVKSDAGATLSGNNLTLTFAPGATTAKVTVTPGDDSIAEPSETVVLNVATAVGYTVLTPPNSATGTIVDNDVASASIQSTASVLEGGNNKTTTVNLTVTLSTASSQTVTVTYATANAGSGTGFATAGTDYVAKSGTLTFAPGILTQTISVTVNGDNTRGEGNETFLVTIASPSVPVTNSISTVTILDDDGP